MRAVWTDKKRERERARKRDVWESQREESKQVRINDTQAGFFPPFCGRRKEGARAPQKGKNSSPRESNEKEVKVASSWKSI